MWAFIHQYAYFFSLLFFILPISIGFDALLQFRVIRKIATLKGVFFVLLSVIFWSLFDIFWIHGLGTFPSNRVIGTIAGVPIEEMMLFAFALYNIAAIFAWAKEMLP